MHVIILLFGVILFAVISLLIGLFLKLLLFATRVGIALIILRAFIVSAFVAIALVTLMIVAVLVMMMSVVQAMAASNRKMISLLLLWLYLLLELVKDTGCFVSKKAKSQRGSMGAVLVVSTNLSAFGCTRKICLLFSCAVGVSPLFGGGDHH